jgi:hypothetical protein
MSWPNFYSADYIVEADIDSVEQAILTRQLDLDGISNWDWCKAFVTADDMPHMITEHILRNKNDPAIKPLYNLFRDVIEGVLDK